MDTGKVCGEFMTREEIENMPAGREMDALIAEKVFTGDYPRSIDSANGLQRTFPFFSKDVSAAWKVVEKVQQIDPHWSPGINWDDDDGDGNPMWIASFTYYGEDEKDFKVNEVWDKSAPLAICRAALLAVIPL
jgi:hypothetical protein